MVAPLIAASILIVCVVFFPLLLFILLLTESFSLSSPNDVWCLCDAFASDGKKCAHFACFASSVASNHHYRHHHWHYDRIISLSIAVFYHWALCECWIRLYVCSCAVYTIPFDDCLYILLVVRLKIKKTESASVEPTVNSKKPNKTNSIRIILRALFCEI